MSKSKDQQHYEEILSKIEEIQSRFNNSSSNNDVDFMEKCYEYKSSINEILQLTKTLKWKDWQELKKLIMNHVNELTVLVDEFLTETLQDIPCFISNEIEYKILCVLAVTNCGSLFYRLWVNQDFHKFKKIQRNLVNGLIKYLIENRRKEDYDRFIYGEKCDFKESDLNVLSEKLNLENYFYDNSSRFKLGKSDLLDRKKSILSEFKWKYPQATWACKKMLFSQKYRNELCSEFLEQEKSFLVNRLKNSNVMNINDSRYMLDIISLFLSSYLDIEKLDKKFESFLRNEVEQAFIDSSEKKIAYLQKQENKTSTSQRINVPTSSIKVNEKVELPEWMEEDIKNLDLEESDVASLIKFLRVELTNFWWNIKKSHIIDKLKRIDEPELLPDFLSLLDNYDEFCVIDDDEKRQTPESLTKTPDWDKQINLSKEQLLAKELVDISAQENVEERLSWYLDMFEKLWYQFKDKEDFLSQFLQASKKTEKNRLENSVFSALRQRISGYESLEKKRAFWYRAMRLNYKAWRIVFTDMQITHILSHDDYMKLINTKPR